MLGDETHLARRRPGLVDHQFRNDRVELGERLAQDKTGLIIAGNVARNIAAADQADKNAGGAQRPESTLLSSSDPCLPNS